MKALLAVTKRLLASNKISFILLAAGGADPVLFRIL